MSFEAKKALYIGKIDEAKFYIGRHSIQDVDVTELVAQVSVLGGFVVELLDQIETLEARLATLEVRGLS